MRTKTGFPRFLGSKIPLSQSLYWRPSADQKARGLWVRDCPGIGHYAVSGTHHWSLCWLLWRPECNTGKAAQLLQITTEVEKQRKKSNYFMIQGRR